MNRAEQKDVVYMNERRTPIGDRRYQKDRIDFALDHETGIRITNRPIDSLSEFDDLITTLPFGNPNKYPPRLTLFRGQKEIKWNLEPQIARPGPWKFSLENEKAMLEDFKLRALPYLPGTRQNLTDLEMLALAQHHGMATRLLDWTEHALIGLWFAVRDAYSEKEMQVDPHLQGVVWVFQPEQKDVLDASDCSKDPFRFAETKVYHPGHFAHRIQAQGGWFTVHKYNRKLDRLVRLNRLKEHKGKLWRISIEAVVFTDIAKQLQRAGITAATAFPDLTGVAEFINSALPR